MACKPTVGEVRRVGREGARFRVFDVVTQQGAQVYWTASMFGRPHWPEIERCPIVEVAPKNRARVTAGPEWMR